MYVALPSLFIAQAHRMMKPDGRQLAYGAARDGHGMYVYIVRADGYGAKRITGKGWSYAPDWQPAQLSRP